MRASVAASASEGPSPFGSGEVIVSLDGRTNQLFEAHALTRLRGPIS